MPSPLTDLIVREAASRPLALARYMDLALQHPEHGYYRRLDPLGKSGDFITAPEISQVFGELIGLWCADLWQKLGSPPEFLLLELGPGRGTMLADALRATRAVPGFHAALRLALLESNAALRSAQAEKLAPWQPRWLPHLHDLPPVPSIILANEFFDALPIRQFVRAAAGWQERCVGAMPGKLAWLMMPPDPAIALLLTPAQQALPLGAYAEVSPAAQHMMQHAVQQVQRQGGALLAIDYGYAQPSGSNTLQAVAAHAYQDPLAQPGEADLTAHVDFDALAAVAHALQAQAWPLLEQGAFLQRLGIAQRVAQLAAGTDAAQQETLRSACQRLTAPEAMGRLFKVLCVTGSPALVPAGWEGAA